MYISLKFRYTSLSTPSHAQQLSSPRMNADGHGGAQRSTKKCLHADRVFLKILLCVKSEQYNEKHSNVKEKIEKDEQN